MRICQALKFKLLMFIIFGASFPILAASDTSRQTQTRIPADNAIELATATETVEPTDPLSETESSTPSKSSNSEFNRHYTRCMGEIAIYGLLPITAAGADGAQLSIFTSVFGTVFCVPLAGGVVTTEPSLNASIEATSRKNHAAYRKTERYRFFARTSENLARWIWQRLKPGLPELSKIVVQETCNAGCVYLGDQA